MPVVVQQIASLSPVPRRESLHRVRLSLTYHIALSRWTGQGKGGNHHLRPWYQVLIFQPEKSNRTTIVRNERTMSLHRSISPVEKLIPGNRASDDDFPPF